MAKFCANLSFIFTDVPFVERYAAASRAGFKAVESGFPYQVPIEEVTAAKKAAGIQQVLINVYTGDVTKGELGFAAVPGEEENFKNSVHTTIEYAKALGASKIHVMSGRVTFPTAQNDTLYESNLRYAAKIFEKENILGLIEPINKYSVPGYYLNSYDKALKVLKNINSPNLRLMLDVFHLQHIQGNITNTMQELKDWIGHVQIAQVPNRNEPDTLGEINYAHVLTALRTVGYQDWIGLEYKPQGDPVAGLKWITSLGYSL